MAKDSKNFQKWERTIEKAKKAGEELNNRTKEAIGWYENDLKRIKESNKDLEAIPMISTRVRASITVPFARLPEFSAIPKDEKSVGSAKLAEAILQQTINDSNMFAQFKQFTLWAGVGGKGVLKVGYRSNANGYERTEKEMYDSYVNTDSIDLSDAGFAEFKKEPDNTIDMYPDGKEGAYISNIKTTDFFHDPNAPTLEAGKWAGFRKFITKKEFEETWGKHDFEPGHYYEEDEDVKQTDDKENKGLIEVFEIWCKDPKKYYVMATGVGEFLESSDWPYDMDGMYPFVVAVMVPRVAHPLEPVIEIESMISSARIYNENVTHRKNAMLSNNGIILTEKGALDEDQQAALTAPSIRDKVVEVNDISRIRVLEKLTISPDIYMGEDKAQRIMEDVQRTSHLQLGGESRKKKTATEVKAQAGALTAQSTEKMRLIEKALEETYKRVLWLIQMFYDQDQVIRIEQDVGPAQFIRWKNTDLGTYEIEIKTGTAAFTDSNQKLNEALQWQQLVMELVNTKVGRAVIVNPAPLIKTALFTIGNQLGVNPAEIKKSFEPPEIQQQQIPGGAMPAAGDFVPGTGDGLPPGVLPPGQTQPQGAI